MESSLIQESDLLVNAPSSNAKESITREQKEDTPTLYANGYQPLGHASFIEQLLFLWPNRLMGWASQHSLHISDMGDISSDDKIQVQIEKLKASWITYKEKAEQSKYQLAKAAVHAFRKEYMKTFCLGMIGTTLQFTNPFLISAIITFIQTPSEPLSKGVFLFCILALVQFLNYIAWEHIKFSSVMTGIRSQNALIGLLYEKTLRLSPATNKDFNQGEIINFIQTDASKLLYTSKYLPFITTLPIIGIVCFTTLFFYLGASVLCGIVMFALGFFFNQCITTVYFKYHNKYMEVQDKRINIPTETLNNVKTVKVNSWVSLFEGLIQEKRSIELSYLKKKFKLALLFITNFYFLPFMVSTSVYATYIGSDHRLDLNIAYTTSLLFLLIEDPLRELPEFITVFLECIVSLKRMQQFLLCPEVNSTQIAQHQSGTNHNSVEINNGNFTWGAKFQEDSDKAEQSEKDEKKSKSENESQEKVVENDKSLEELTCLKNLSLEVRRGEFICIIGDVGAGKSSLLNCLLGDLMFLSHDFLEENKQEKVGKEFYEKVKTEARTHYSKQFAPIQIYSDISYVQQQPWIQNMSIRDNILFGLPYQQDKYEEVIDICELERDLEILPNGDLTEIGEKGINLSGGQKARVSLARAVYADKPIILMDDPISALDSNVKKSIFQKVFMEKFKHKTRVLVTHALDFLEHVDTVIVIKNGRIILKGNYQDIKTEKEIIQVMSIHNSHKEQQEHLNSDQLLELPEELAGVDISLEEESSDPSRSNSSSKACNYSANDINSSLTSKMIEDENNEKTNLDWSVYKEYIFKYMGGWYHVVLIQIFQICYTVLQIAFDYWTGYWASAEDQYTNFWYYCGLKFLFLILCCLCVFFRLMINLYYTWHGVKTLHENMIRQVFNAPINLYFDVTPIGRILNRFSKDLDTIQDDLPFTFSAAIATFYISLSMVITSVIAIPWTVFIYPFIGYALYRTFIKCLPSIRETSRIVNVTKSPIVSHLQETLAGTSTIRAFKKEKEFNHKFYKLLNQNTLANLWKQGVSNAFVMRINLICWVILIISFLLCLVYRDSGNDIMLALMLVYLIQFSMVINFFLQELGAIEKEMVNVERCLRLTKVETEALEYNDSSFNVLAWRKDWPEQGDIEFREVSLKYRPNTEMVLRNISFDVKGGEKIGVVGRTGAGKSTICLSMSRIIELLSGQILIDGIDIKTLNLYQLRRRITVIPQDPTMFKGTLRFNLDPEGKVSKDRILEVVKEARLESLIEMNEKGLEQEVEEGGQNLSSGEKQLICICRAILRKSKVVILDEATANIDVVTEKKIQELIKLEFKDSTMITIAHRINTIIESDRVLVLSFGQIVEFDSPQTLMKNQNSEFRKLLRDIQQEKAQ